MKGGPPGAVVTVGTFDGVHRGHRLVLARLALRARERGLRGVLVTFSPHPLEIVNPAAAPMLLTTGEEKSEILVETQIDRAVILPFTPALARYDAEQFVDEVLLGRLGMRSLLIGYDHGLGRGRSGDAAVLEELGASRGFAVEVVPAVQARDGRPISSTSIRRQVAGGDLARATDGLGRPYSVSGVVVPGAARGRLLGFRTLNLAAPPLRKLLPPEGVYAVRVVTSSGSFGGMLNLGPRPTFGETATTLEAHLFDADGDWYGARIRVEFVARVRETRKFPSAEALIVQLGHDEEVARAVIGRASAGM
ncbi:MAG TPA: bifunctional riboflavin kinase/FAD synthetase [Gemmatimonadaceae bacterium]|nr:bifunctional riboflavin kinase/FAD synthetase [Gemmatimonadaceae bacterium]